MAIIANVPAYQLWHPPDKWRRSPQALRDIYHSINDLKLNTQWHTIDWQAKHITWCTRESNPINQ